MGIAEVSLASLPLLDGVFGGIEGQCRVSALTWWFFISITRILLLPMEVMLVVPCASLRPGYWFWPPSGTVPRVSIFFFERGRA
jgi:hypothetical protein